MTSRLLGVVREQVLASLFGATGASAHDSATIADPALTTRAPNLIRPF